MKKCTECKKEKALEEFFVKRSRKDGRSSDCKKCHSKRFKSWYAENKESFQHKKHADRKRKSAELHDRLRQYVIDNNGCRACGETDYAVVEFDHRDAAIKEFCISEGVSREYSWEKVLSELIKCDILCANCHRRKTAKDFDWYCA